MKKFFILTVLFCFLTGCTSLSQNKEYEGPKPLPSRIAANFFYPNLEPEYKVTLTKETKKYTLYSVGFKPYSTIPVDHTIKLNYYRNNKSSKSPVILVLPILGGDNQVAEMFAKYFANNSFSAVIVGRQEGYKDISDIKNVNSVLKQIVIDHMQAIDFIEKQKEFVDASKIGVFGVSMGGIKAALISALDSRVKASVLCLAGGDLPYILTRSSEKGIKKRVEKILREKNITLDQLYKLLKEIITCDPIKYAEYIDSENTLMVLAGFDTVVPFKKGIELRNKIGKPETIVLPAGHYTAVLFVWYIEGKALDFFKKKLVN